MAAGVESYEGEGLVYRISTEEEWEELQQTGFTHGGDLDKSTRFIHLSTLHQVKPTLQRFFLNTTKNLYLLQIDAKKLGEGLVYELVDGSINDSLSPFLWTVSEFHSSPFRSRCKSGETNSVRRWPVLL